MEDVLGIDEETGIITMHLSQEETGLFKEGVVELQVNIYYENTERDTSTAVLITAKDNLYKKVMTNE